MKDYLNSKERLMILSLIKVAEQSNDLLNSSLMTKDEQSNLKRGITFTMKAAKGIIERLNKSALKTFINTLNNSQVYIGSKFDIDTYAKKKVADIEAAYEENKEYFRLIELILFYNCQDCQKDCKECLFYEEFENNCIPEFSTKEQIGKCRYAYKGDK